MNGARGRTTTTPTTLLSTTIGTGRTPRKPGGPPAPRGPPPARRAAGARRAAAARRAASALTAAERARSAPPIRDVPRPARAAGARAPREAALRETDRRSRSLCRRPSSRRTDARRGRTVRARIGRRRMSGRARAPARDRARRSVAKRSGGCPGKARTRLLNHPEEQHRLHDEHRGQTGHEADRDLPVEALVPAGAMVQCSTPTLIPIPLRPVSFLDCHTLFSGGWSIISGVKISSSCSSPRSSALARCRLRPCAALGNRAALGAVPAGRVDPQPGRQRQGSSASERAIRAAQGGARATARSVPAVVAR